MISIHVPAMSSRQDVRAISARICDVPGVQTIQVDLATRTVEVTGYADPAAVGAAIRAAGYAFDPWVDGSSLPAPARTGGPSVDTFFSTDTTGLPEGTAARVVELADGETLGLRSVPGRTLKVQQDSEVVVHVTNDTDLDTSPPLLAHAARILRPIAALLALAGLTYLVQGWGRRLRRLPTDRVGGHRRGLRAGYGLDHLAGRGFLAEAGVRTTRRFSG